MNSTTIDEFKDRVYTEPDLARILGIFEAYVKGKQVTKNWVFGQITKGHNIPDALDVLNAFSDHLKSINQTKFFELQSLFKQ